MPDNPSGGQTGFLGPRPSGSSGAMGNGLTCFPTIADMAAFDTTLNPDACIGFVETVLDYFWHDAGAAAVTDAVNFSTTAATGGGAWLRQGNAHDEWARDMAAAGGVWVSTAGSNENNGTSALTPLRTNSEINRRLHGLVVPRAGNFDHTLLTNSDDDDPVIYHDVWFYTVDQTAVLRIVGGKTVAASGTISVVQNLAAATNTPVEIVTSVSLDAQLGKYIQTFSAGPTFRCSGWVDKIITAGSRYRLSCPTAQNGFTGSSGNVNPVVGNTFEVYNLRTVPDILLDGSHVPAGVRILEIDINNTAGGGFAEFALPEDGLFFAFATKFSETIYWQKETVIGFDNCHFATPWVSPFFGNIGLSAGLYKGGRFPLDSNGRSNFLTNDSPMFTANGCLSFENTYGIQDATGEGIAIFDCTALACVRVGDRNSLTMPLLWGSGNTVPGIQFAGFNSRVFCRANPVLVTTAAAIRFEIDTVNQLFTDLALTNIRDTHGNEIIGTAGQIVTQTVRVSCVVEGTIALGDVVANGSGAANVVNRATCAVGLEGPQIQGISITAFADGAFGFIVKAGHARVGFTGAAPAVNDAVWLTATTGKVSNLVPAGGDGSPIFDNGIYFVGTVLAVGAAHVLVALSGLGLGEAFNEMVFADKQFFADQLDFPDNADWAVNAMAPAAQDSLNAAITVRRFDDTTEEGVGFWFRPPQRTQGRIRLVICGRPETAPAAVRTVGLKLYVRPVTDNTVVPAWDSVVLADFNIEANSRFQMQSYEISPPGLAAATFAQFELTRINPTAGTELVGDFDLLGIAVWVVPVTL